jgi:hypothetical protein
MVWKIFSVSTDTWGDKIELPADDPRGARALNTGAAGTTVFQVGDPLVAEVVTAYTVAPLERALVIEWDGKVVYCGLILDVDEDQDAKTLTVTHTDIWWIFQFRHVLAMHGDGAQRLPPLVYVSSLETIAKYVVIEGADAGPIERYRLPIVWPADVPGTDRREYYGYKFLSVADALDELIKSERGPDVDFSPRWSAAGKLELLMRSGILTTGLWEWDTTAEKSGVSKLKHKTNGAKVTNKVIATGEGSERELLVKAEESFAGPLYPALERVVSYQGISDRDQLAARARADLATANEPTRQLSFTISTEGDVKVSDLVLGGFARIKTKGLRFLPDGWSDWRLIQYDFDRTSVSLQFQQQGG